MKNTKLIGLLGLLSGALHVWTFMGFGELRYFSLVFVVIYGGLGLLVYLGKRWALYAIGVAMFIGGIGATASFATNTLPEWIRIILIAIDVVVVIGVLWILYGERERKR
jgi:bacteriorhodopsin